MLLILIFALISEVHDKGVETEYKYTISVNPLSFAIEGAGHGGVLIVPTPGINFELRALGRLSLNFELNNAFFIIPVEFEVGIREYLLKEFEGVYIYQGVAAAVEKEFPILVLTLGSKGIRKDNKFTADIFLGLKAFHSKNKENRNISKAVPFLVTPAMGLYLGYSW
jgi:hypothetical protein